MMMPMDIDTKIALLVKNNPTSDSTTVMPA